jgi:hypothetical protein
MWKTEVKNKNRNLNVKVYHKTVGQLFPKELEHLVLQYCTNGRKSPHMLYPKYKELLNREELLMEGPDIYEQLH